MQNSGSGGGSQPPAVGGGFDWVGNILLRDDPGVSCVPVSAFRFAPAADIWEASVMLGLKLEVKNSDYVHPANVRGPQPDPYWVATVVNVAGYFVRLRYEGFDEDDGKDFWLNVFTTQLHPVGWACSQGKHLIPPDTIRRRHKNWHALLMQRLGGARTLPDNFYEQLKDCLKSRFRPGMRLEVIDKKRISAVRVAQVTKVIGGRLHIVYEQSEDDSGFWCHQYSSLIHPVGWAQIVGHELRATTEYARSSLQKAMHNQYDSNDSDFTMFPAVDTVPPNERGFRQGMKLEAIDPLNLSAICVATVMKCLRDSYLMIGIDGMMAPDGTDWFCYHATSPCIFPVGFCEENGLPLTPPQGWERNFTWDRYLTNQKAIAAPRSLFRTEKVAHQFREGMLLEAVDLMEPRLVCVATVTKVVGRLLKIHFNGWDDTYDQWCDCESAELYPAGWCQMVGYPLEPPKDSEGHRHASTISATSMAEKKQKKHYKGYIRRKKKRPVQYSAAPKGSNGTAAAAESSEVDLSSSFEAELPKLERLANGAGSSEASSSPKAAVSKAKQMAEVSSSSSIAVVQSPPEPIDDDISGPAADWTVHGVARFLADNDCGHYSSFFLERNVDGGQLVALKYENILDIVNKKVGPALKINALVQKLQ